MYASNANSGIAITGSTASNVVFKSVDFGFKPVDPILTALRDRISSLMDYLARSWINAIAECLYTQNPVEQAVALITFVPERDPENEGWIVSTRYEDAEGIVESWSFTDDELYIEEFDWMPGDE